MERHRRYRFIQTLVCACLTGLSALSLGAETIQISMPENVAITSVALPVLQRAYDKLGITLKMEVMPMRRSLQAASSGEVDGELMRTAQTLQQTPLLVAVKVPLVRVGYFAYQLAPCPPGLTVAELQQQRVAYFRGTRAIEMLLPASALIAATSHSDALRRLPVGTAKYVMGEELETDALLAKHGLRGSIMAGPVVP